MREEQSGQVAPPRQVDHIQSATGDSIHQRQVSSAGTDTLTGYAEVAHFVADERHAVIIQICQKDSADLTGPTERAVFFDKLDVEIIYVQVESAPALALCSNQHHLTAAVTVKDLAAEGLLNHLLLMLVDHFGGSDDAARRRHL